MRCDYSSEEDKEEQYSSKGLQVLRTKLFEEGENDVESECPEQSPEPHSAKSDMKNKLENSGGNFYKFLAHSESPSKWNHANISSYEEVMNFASQMVFCVPHSDLFALIEMHRANHKELCCKPTWYGILIHNRRFEKWNYTKPRSYERVIDFSNQLESEFGKSDQHDLFGDLRFDQKESGYKPNYYVILTHQGRSEIWNHIKPRSYEEVMDF